MVTAGRAARWTRRLLRGLGDDFRQFRAAIRSRRPLRPGLYAYGVEAQGMRRRFHLRVAADGSALLLIDVTEAIHLNPTAALLASLALDAVPVERASAALCGRFRDVTREETEVEAGKI